MASFRDLNGPASPPLAFRPVCFSVERFEYSSADLLLRLSIRISLELQSPRPMLFIEREGLEHGYTPLVSCTCNAPPTDPQEWLWRGAFPVPLDLASGPRGSFVLSLRDDLLLALPEPDFCILGDREGSERNPGRRAWPYAIRRTALMFVVMCQFSLGPALLPGLSGASSGAATQAEATPEAQPQPPGEGPGEPGPEAPPEQPAGGPTPEPPATPNPGEPTQPSPEPPPAPSTGEPSPPASDTPSQSAPATPTNPGGASAVGEAKGAVDASAPSPADVGAARPRRVTAPPRPGRRKDSRGAAGKRQRRHRAPRRDTGPVAHQPIVPGPPTLDQAEVPALLAGLPTGLLGGFEQGPPAYLIPIYKEAGHRYHLPWRVLAAINGIESDYGRNLAVSSAGALGWMQFMPDTWRQWAVDADGDGHLNPYSPLDAIFTAARYLKASGAARDLPAAIFAYNHADWYVTEVLLRAHMIGNVASFARVEKGYALPLDAQYMQPFGRTDDGVDFEAAADGALVYSITPGIVSAVASDPTGFGPDYPVIEATSGPLAGQHIYYGHVAAALVQPGQSVHAGQPIAIIGHTGDAVSLGHGHIEIGFSDAGGDPLSHHGVGAWTPAGAVMRSFLLALSADFGVHNTL
ncbi:MAG: Lytic transglycosylase catalytic [Solirubrobacterales bacterium]|nr:Lytic transglycosylase catalytic [Solirubrobacterales bacterium]